MPISIKDTSQHDTIETERILADIYANTSTIVPTILWPSKIITPEWAAGFIDGEGHFGINKHIRHSNSRPQYLTRIQIGNTVEELLTPFLIFGGKVMHIRASRWNPNAADCFKWTIHNRQAQKFIHMVLPYMKNWKKIEAAKVLLKVEFLRKRPGGHILDDQRIIQQEHYYKTVMLLNKRGILSIEDSQNIEALRHGNPKSEHIPEFSGIEEEMADAVIRIMDFSESRRLRLGEAIEAKMAFNKSRPQWKKMPKSVRVLAKKHKMNLDNSKGEIA